MQKIRPVVWFGLAAAAGLYWFSRTQYGVRYITYATDAASDAASGVVEVVKSLFTPRGIRNNNPGNIDRVVGTNWQGMAPDQSTDGRFVVFVAPVWGLRAIARVLRSYRNRGLTTVRQIISTWAPPIENATGAYVDAVARSLGVSPDAPIDDAHLPGLIAAIVQHENGQQPYAASTIIEAINLERTT